MNINEFIQEYRKCEEIAPNVTSCHTPHVMCDDGFTMSVQAGPSLYSIPRDVADNYKAVEVGYPSEDEPLLKDYNNLFDGDVYAYVPCKIIDKIIKKHGGIDVEFHNEATTEGS